MKTIALLFALILFTFQSSAQICINEIMASNGNVFKDENDNYPDWIELFNDTDQEVNLSGFYMSDDYKNKLKHQFPASNSLIIKPYEYLVVFASGESQKGARHLNFTLSPKGKRLYLVSPNGKKNVDKVNYRFTTKNISTGRKTDGSRVWRYFNNTTPGASNDTEEYYKGITSAPKIKTNGGVYSNPKTIKIKKQWFKTKIFYSLEGSTPSTDLENPVVFKFKNSYRQNPSDPDGPLLSKTMQNFEYDGKIEMIEPKDIKNNTSLFSSTFDRNPTYIPNYNVPKAMVLKAVAQKKHRLPSTPVASTYFVGDIPHKFPVISLQVNQKDLFDYETGIYTAGKKFDDFRKTNGSNTELCTPGNYSESGGDWEVTGSFEYFENNKLQYNENVSMRLHGGCSKSFPYKSLRIYSERQFGNLDFFKGKTTGSYSNIILRNSGNDYNNSMFKDAFIHQWFKNLKFPIQEYRPSILYLNGEYWGIHNIRERPDKYFVQKKYGVDPNAIDMIKIVFYGPEEISDGNDVEFKKMKTFFQNTNLSSKENYDKATQLIDIENFIDFQIAHIYIGNIDWPQNNVRLWRQKTEIASASSKYGHDGKWRWLFFDTDRGLGEVVNVNFDNLSATLNKPESYILNSLLNNTTFKNQFVKRFIELIDTEFLQKNAYEIFDKMKAELDPEVDEHIKRWKNIQSKVQWTTNCNTLKSYITARPNVMKNILTQRFGNIEVNDLSVLIDTTQGFVIANSESEQNSLIGKFNNKKFLNNETINLTAVAKEGYKFKSWTTVNGNAFYERVFTFGIKSDTVFVANFEKIKEIENELEVNNTIQSSAVNLFNISKGISPNEDGINDLLKIELLNGNEIEDIKFFTSKGLNVNMNLKQIEQGKSDILMFEIQKNQPEGTYYYLLKLKNEKEIFSDFVTISY